RFINAIEQATGKQAVRNHLPMQAGDVPRTFADVSDLTNDVAFKPETEIETGIERFIGWYLNYAK
ncbi:MAG: protein CapI, partial [Sphingobacteriales bacterium]|nr:protein CapI [Sphingobacteriales bacterium]MBD3822034.1 protein CapI [Thiotrichales bacterium]